MRKRDEITLTDSEAAALTADHRAILVKFCDGLSYQDIALELGVPIGTVRSRLNRARRKLIALREAAAQKEAA